MPLSSIFFERSPAQKDEAGSVNIPDWAVLFYYGNVSDWKQTSSGTLNFDYYGIVSQYTMNYATIGLTAGPQMDYPIIACTDQYDTAYQASGYYGKTIDTGLANYGTLLDIAGAHNPTTLNFRSAGVPLAFAFNTGDTVSSVATDTFISQTGGHFGHQHYTEGSDLSTVLNNKANASGPIPSESFGIPQLGVIAVQKNPGILAKPTLLGWLPKNVIVFGADLPANNASGTQQYFSRTDTFNTGSRNFNTFVPGNTYVLTSYTTSHGGYYNPSTNITITSNTFPDHTHNVFPVATQKKSNKTGQRASIETAAGAHNHPVTYNMTAYIQTKKLKAWITQNDKTPIANGVIIGYAPNLGFGASITASDSVQSLLPSGWYVCDGNNGTPDLRGFFVGANFNDSDHDVDITNYVYGGANKMAVNSITVTSNGAHSHVTAGNLNITGQTGTPKDIGSHLLEPSTAHSHPIATNETFLNSSRVQRTNLKVGSSFSFTPASLQMSFIMYNATAIQPGYDVTVPPPDIVGGGGPD